MAPVIHPLLDGYRGPMRRCACHRAYCGYWHAVAWHAVGQLGVRHVRPCASTRILRVLAAACVA